MYNRYAYLSTKWEVTEVLYFADWLSVYGAITRYTIIFIVVMKLCTYIIIMSGIDITKRNLLF